MLIDRKEKRYESATVMKWQTGLMNYRNPKTDQPYSQTYMRQIHN